MLCGGVYLMTSARRAREERKPSLTLCCHFFRCVHQEAAIYSAKLCFCWQWNTLLQSYSKSGWWSRSNHNQNFIISNLSP